MATSKKPAPEADPEAAREPAPQTRRRSLKSIGPEWLQAVAAVAGVVLTALIVFGIIQDRSRPAATQPPAASSVPGQPSVTLDSVTTDADTVEAEGSYFAIDQTRQAVLLIGRPVDAAADELWVPVVAELIPDDPSTPSSGRWHATRPGVPEGRWRWFALIGPAAAGAGDAYEDLRENGPQSVLVVVVSEGRETE